MTTPDDTQHRIQIQELGGALLKLGAADATAATLLTKLFQVVADEAAVSKRFARALSTAFASSSVDGGEPVAHVARKAVPRKRAAAPKKPARKPGVFDPFAVFNESGEAALAERLAVLDIEQLRDIIAEQEIDTRSETGRKRKGDVIAAWTVERVKALASKGSVFR